MTASRNSRKGCKMELTLEPCPYCGNQPKRHSYQYDTENGVEKRYRMHCSHLYKDIPYKTVITDPCTDLVEAMLAWNLKSRALRGMDYDDILDIFDEYIRGIGPNDHDKFVEFLGGG